MTEYEAGAVIGDNSIPGVRLDRAFERWHAAQTQLAKAIQEFSDASSALQGEASLPYNALSGYVKLDANLAALDAALKETSQDNQRLSRDCAKLKAIRNHSAKIAPISKLSEDILCRIFSTLTRRDHTHCGHGSEQGATRKDVNETRYALVFSSVCSSWRHIVINTPSFWSHIDLSIVSGRYVVTEYMKLAAQRASDTPIDLHIVCKDGEELYSIDQPVNLALLPKNLHRCKLTSLNLILYHQTTANFIMHAWIDNFGSSTSLAVRLVNAKKPLDPRLVYGTLDLDVFYSKLRLHSLELSHVPMEWDRVSFSALRNLKLGNMVVSNRLNPLGHQFYDMLVACPELRTLRLSRVGFSYTAPLTALTPIEIPKLTHLSFDRIYLDQMQYLVKLVVPGPEFSSLTVWTIPRGIPEKTLDLLEPWCKPYNIDTLSLRVENAYPAPKRLGRFLSSFKHLHTEPLVHSLTQ